jgi:Amt family ammonium transporter
MGFVDFAGSTIVHSVGGWAALMGAILLGPRLGKYIDGKVTTMRGSSMPLVTLGTFILWMGWFGFNGGSQLALGTAADAISMANVMVNTTLAAAGGVVAAIIYCQLRYGKVDLTLVLNGALAGLVAITAGPDTPAPYLAILIGSVGAILASLAIPLLDKLKIDDVVGAIPVHLVAGIWGTLAVVLSNPDASILVQLIGVGSTGAFVMMSSFIVWFALKKTIGIRACDQSQTIGLDIHELGIQAYPEFVREETAI